MTPAQLKKVMPYAGARADKYAEPLTLAMDEFGIDSPQRQAAFLAQIAHESGSLRYVLELASGEAYEGRKDLGNTRPEAISIARTRGSTPGPMWKGRGLLQITGYDNYAACSHALFGDGRLLIFPRLLEEPLHACRSAGWFWQSRGLNALADTGQFKAITRAINGGYNGYADRLAHFQRATQVLA